VEKLELPHVCYTALLLNAKTLVDHLSHTVPITSRTSALVEKALHFEGLLHAGGFGVVLCELKDHFCHARLVPVVNKCNQHVVGRHDENNDFYYNLVHEVHFLITQSAGTDAHHGGVVSELQINPVVAEGL